MSDEPSLHDHEDGACHAAKRSIDWLLWGSLGAIIVLYALHWLVAPVGSEWLIVLSHSVFELMNLIWWGIVLGVIMISVLGRIPREFVMSALGTGRGASGVIRASFAGVLLDLCNHGILMVGAKLYERGASAGQVIAFLLASPWNSFSFTLILIGLIGFSWTLAFIAISMLVAIVAGLAFERLCAAGVLPQNSAELDLPQDFHFWREARAGLNGLTFSASGVTSTLIDGIKESRMVVRWILFGVLLASVIRAFIGADQFETYFGPTLLGLGATLLFATVLEVCSEGSIPIAADLFGRAGAPGNSFAFLMGGVATDYTEIMVLKDTTASWKIALFMPLLTLPQIVAVAWLLNLTAG